MAVSCKTTIKKDVRKKHSRPLVVDDLKGTPTFDKEPKTTMNTTYIHSRFLICMSSTFYINIMI